MILLSEQSAPRKGAKAGYYPDPLGGRRARWWDGRAWTLQVGPLVPPDAPKGKAVSPATKACRHCGAQTDTFEGSCPNCGKPYGQSSGWVIAAIVAACVVFILFLGGCAVLFGVLIGSIHRSHSISQGDFNSVTLGTTRSAAQARLGSPYDTYQYTSTSGRAVSCIYYHQRGDGSYSRGYYGLCFAQGRLISKQDHG